MAQLSLSFQEKSQTQEIKYGEIPRYRVQLVREPSSPLHDSPSVGRPANFARFATSIVADLDREALGVVFLDSRQYPIAWMLASIGTLNHAAVEPRGLIVPALLCNASGILAFHNHPSGDPTPSGEDLVFTQRLRKACEVVGLRLLDHLVIGEPGRWTSLREKVAF